MFTVTVVDESTAGARGEARLLGVPAETLTLRELIRRKVAESTSGADVEAEADVAVAAFERNGFVVLVDERQVEELDSPVRLTPASIVTFLKLVPLVGG